LIDTMFNLPSATDVEKVVISADTIEHDHPPLLVYRKQAAQPKAA
jgi:ATP-dependent Clp protease ATP-binding subunit ClpX